ncbi:HNH endonuclease [Micrococcus sp. KT16]|uniref:HNH endonuclease n=1 Tax=Micrococcus sp. KT16 TaxID=2184005 RepID=UPI000DE841F0
MGWAGPEGVSLTADHITPRALGGKLMGELRPAHRSCNSRRGKRMSIEMIPKPKTTRQW